MLGPDWGEVIHGITIAVKLGTTKAHFDAAVGIHSTVASDTSHYYERFETDRCFTTVFNIGDTLEGNRVLRRLAESALHIVPGHDPLVMARCPVLSEALEGIAVRLDSHPAQ